MEGVLAEVAAQWMFYKPTKNRQTEERDEENKGESIKGVIMGMPLVKNGILQTTEHAHFRL